MTTKFQTEYLFKRLPDFWSRFEDREDQKNIWDAFLRKSQALHSLLRQANFSKSLKSIPLLDRNQLEYFIFSKLVRRTDRELNRPFYVYEVDPTIFFVKNLYEKIDATEGNRVLSAQTYYQVTPGTGSDQGKTFLEFLRGVAPVQIGETYWTKGSIQVTGTGTRFLSQVSPGDIIQGPNNQFHKVTFVDSDTLLRVQGPTVIDQVIGSGDGSTTAFNLRTPDIFTEISDELVLTGPVAPGVQSLAYAVYDPATLELKYGSSFDTGIPLVLDSDYTITDPNAGTFTLTAAGASTIGADQLHARYKKAEPYIITSSVEIWADNRLVPPVSYYSDELVATGPLAPGVFQLDYYPVDSGSLELRAGSITGTLLATPADYTVNLTNGQVTLTASGAAKVNAASPKELHAKYSRTEYTVNAYGVVTFTSPPASTVAEVTASYFLGYFGPTGTTRRTTKESAPVKLFSRAVYRDRAAVYTNFGYAIGYEKPTSQKYLNEVRGLYFARYNGPTITNMSLGAGILIGIPFSPRGKVNRVQSVSPKSVVVDGNLIPVPDPLTPTVTTGDWLPRDFNLLTDGVRTADFINDPALFQLSPIYDDIRKFFTFFVLVKGSYAVWVCQQTGQPIDYSLLTKFIDDIKPSYTDAAVLTDLDFIADGINFFIGAVDVSNSYDAAATVEFNPLNFAVIPQYMRTNGYAYTVGDELVATAPVAAGIYALDFDEILVSGVTDDPTPVPFELHLGTIAGPQLAEGVDYTLDFKTGVVTLLTPQTQDIHAKYTSGLVGESSLAASGTVDLDLDCLQLHEELHVIADTVLIATLENNLVNFGVSPPGPQGMDDDTIQYTESMAINDAIGTPPGSWNPPFSPGALLYSF